MRPNKRLSVQAPVTRLSIDLHEPLLALIVRLPSANVGRLPMSGAYLVSLSGACCQCRQAPMSGARAIGPAKCTTDNNHHVRWTQTGYCPMHTKRGLCLDDTTGPDTTPTTPPASGIRIKLCFVRLMF